MMKLNIHSSIFNTVYLPYLTDYSKRVEIYYGGSGSGKSVFVCQKLVYKALNDKRKILVLRKVGKTVKRSVFQLLIDTLQEFKIYNLCEINKTDYTITLPNGSVFLCSGLDDPEKIKSIVGITDIWEEELTEFQQDDFDQLNLRLRHNTAKNQQIFCSFNPVSKANFCYKLFFKKKTEFDDKKEYENLLDFRNNCMILKTTYLDNRFLPKSYVDSLILLKGTNETYYNIYALGNFASLDKLIYSNYKVDNFDYTKIDGTLRVGLDFGFVSDPTALIALIQDEEHKKLYIFDEWSAKGFTNDRIADVLKAKGYSKSEIYADSAEQKSIVEIKNLGVRRIKPVKKGADSIMFGIRKICQYELIIHPSCTGLLEELQNYSYKKDKTTGEYLETPNDAFNHYCDAMRYSMCDVIFKTKLKTINKSVFGL